MRYPHEAESVCTIVLRSCVLVGHVRLKCPHCECETSLEQSLPVDETVRCENCGVDSEFRQLRERWCESRRSILERACPEIVFPHQLKR